jgi:hypothetical protein
VLGRIRVDLGLSWFLTPLQMRGTGGFTETFSATKLLPADLRSVVDDEEARLNLITLGRSAFL